MNKFIKYIAAAIIIITIIIAFVAGWKVSDHIRQTIHLDLQTSFKDSLSEYGKR